MIEGVRFRKLTKEKILSRKVLKHLDEENFLIYKKNDSEKYHKYNSYGSLKIENKNYYFKKIGLS